MKVSVTARERLRNDVAAVAVVVVVVVVFCM